MTCPDCDRIAAHLARECAAAADQLIDLQIGLGGVADGAHSNAELLTQMQCLDTVQQTMSDLAKMLDLLARDPGVVAAQCWTDALTVVTQTTLRRRLAWGPDTDGKGFDAKTDVDLW